METERLFHLSSILSSSRSVCIYDFLFYFYFQYASQTVNISLYTPVNGNTFLSFDVKSLHTYKFMIRILCKTRMLSNHLFILENFFRFSKNIFRNSPFCVRSKACCACAIDRMWSSSAPISATAYQISSGMSSWKITLILILPFAFSFLSTTYTQINLPLHSALDCRLFYSC